jgi:aspartyl-tRNA(Asn)/glutamyl-tRNA(Gln) amidotransferase subunit B
MLSKEEINATAASRIFDILVDSDSSAKDIAQQEGLLAVTDSGAIETWVDEAIAANAQAVEEIRSGGKKAKKAYGFLMGQVMQKSRGAAQPARVKELLDAKLEQ